MKKYIVFIMVVCICLGVPVKVCASQSEIGTEIPTRHTVAIEGEHAGATYLGESKGEGRVYLVPRFSEPEFQLRVDEGWSIERVLVEDRVVTDQVKNGIIKLPKIYENQTITIETKSIPGAGGGETTGEKDSFWQLLASIRQVADTGDDSAVILALLMASAGIVLCVKSKMS